MRRSLTFISVFALMLGVLQLPAAASSNVAWTGQGSDSLECDEDVTEEMHWVLVMGPRNGTVDLTVNGDTFPMTRKGNSGTWHHTSDFYGEYDFDTGELSGVTASVDTTRGMLVLSNFCPGDEPLTTEALLSGVKYEGFLPSDDPEDDLPDTIAGWEISILDGDRNLLVTDPAMPLLTGADGAWSFQTPTVTVDDPDDTTTYYVCEGQRDGWTQLFPTSTTGTQIAPYGYCHEVEIGVDTPDPDPLNFVNEMTPGDVHIQKVDQNGRALAGISFSLTGPDGYDEGCTTIADGTCSFLGVPVGTGYTLAESSDHVIGEVKLNGETLPGGLPHTFDVALGAAPATGSSYTFSVENILPGTWCSPGYWRNADDAAWVPTGYSRDDLYEVVMPEGSPTVEGDPTLQDVLDSPQTYGGDAFNAVGDLLSEAHPDVDFTGDRIEESCPINNAGQPK